MDKVISKIVALGIPGLILLVVVGTSGYAGGAAIVAALATLGGPFGMLGGIGALGLITLISDSISTYGLDMIFQGVLDSFLKKGMTKNQIKNKIKKYPISKDLKLKLYEALK